MSNAAPSNYRFISDPGHGWLEVTMAEVRRLGVKPSLYSYVNQNMVYLEEDCDAPAFLQEKKRLGEAYCLAHVHEEPTPIRRYARFA